MSIFKFACLMSFTMAVLKFCGLTTLAQMSWWYVLAPIGLCLGVAVGFGAFVVSVAAVITAVMGSLSWIDKRHERKR